MSEYSNKYDDDGFWKKVGKFALKAGKAVIENALKLYYCYKDSDTPTWAKSIIVGALGYFIMPLDAIPDPTPVIGFTDDAGVLVAAVGAVAAHIKKEHVEKAKETLKRWFG